MFSFKDFTKTLWNGISIFGHTLGAKEVWDLVKEGVIPTAADLKAKGWKGILGLGDEQTLGALLIDVDKDADNTSNGYHDAILDFLYWANKPSKDPDIYERYLLWWYGEKWRKFVYGMPSSDGKSIPFKETVTIKKADGTSETTVKETSTQTPGKSYAEEFLRRMGKTLVDGQANKMKTYRLLLRRHKAMGVPYPPTNRTERMRQAQTVFKVISTILAGGLQNIGTKTIDLAKTTALHGAHFAKSTIIATGEATKQSKARQKTIFGWLSR